MADVAAAVADVAETETGDAYRRALDVVAADSARRLDRAGSRGIDHGCAARRQRIARCCPAAAARLLLDHAERHRWRADRLASRLLVAAVIAGAGSDGMRLAARCPDGSTAGRLTRLGLSSSTWQAAVDDLVTVGVVRRTPRTAIGTDGWHVTPELALTDACAWCSTADRRQQQLDAYRRRRSSRRSANSATCTGGTHRASKACCPGRVNGCARPRISPDRRAAGEPRRPPWLSDARCPCCGTGRLAWQPRERGGGLDAVCRTCHRAGRRWQADAAAACVSCGGGVRLAPESHGGQPDARCRRCYIAETGADHLPDDAETAALIDRRERLRQVLASEPLLPVLPAPDRPPPPPVLPPPEPPPSMPPPPVVTLADAETAVAARRAAAAERGEIERAAPPPDAAAARGLLAAAVRRVARSAPGAVTQRMAERDAIDAVAADVAAAVERARAARARINAADSAPERASTEFRCAALADPGCHVAAGAHRRAVERRDVAAARLADIERIAGIACAPRTLLRLPDRDAAERIDHHRGRVARAAAALAVADADAAETAAAWLDAVRAARPGSPALPTAPQTGASP
ncbi:MAG: hypothetical protein OXC62_02565 [Aestuariivita sp.]|nr:hypothetical protein [Aestuariivita sp.]